MSYFLIDNCFVICVLSSIMFAVYDIADGAITWSLLAGLVTFILFQGKEYTDRMMKWNIYLRTIFGSLGFFGITLNISFDIRLFPVTFEDSTVFQNYSLVSAKMPNIMATRKGEEISAIEREIEFLDSLIDFFEQTQNLTHVSVEGKKLETFMLKLNEISANVSRALDIVVNVNPSNDRAIFAITRLVETIGIFSYCVNKRNNFCCTYHEFIVNLLELLCAYSDCLKMLLAEFKKI